MNTNILLIFVVTFLIAFLFGLVVVKLIDSRLNKINLNIENFKNNESKTNTEEEDNENIIHKNEIEVVQSNIVQTNSYNISKKNTTNNINYNFDRDYYEQMNKNSKIEGFTNMENKSFKQWDIQQKETQVCFKNHKHVKDGRDLNCKYGVTNYSDPHDMSPMDYKIFILNYPTNLTLQDYINWLYCFIGKEDELPYNHLKNLEKLKHGKELIVEEGVLPPPGYYYPPLSSEAYFEKMYNDKNEFNLAPPLNSNTGPMIGYNYDEYSEFTQNMDVNGSTGTLRNEDIYLKKNAKKLYNYINPKDSNSLNIDNESEIYRIKNNEI